MYLLALRGIRSLRDQTPSSLRLASDLGDDLFAHAFRHFVVGRELHRVVPAPLGHRTQVGRVTEHLGERDPGGDRLNTRVRLHVLDVAAPGVQVPDDVAHVILGNDDLDLHDRLFQDRPGLLRGVLVRHRARDLERDFGRVHVVVRAIVELHEDSRRRVPGEHAGLQSFLDPLLDRLDELARDRAAADLVVEHEVVPRLGRLQPDLAVSVLAVTTGLPDEAALALRLAGDRLAVSHLGFPDVRPDVELADEAVGDDLQVQLAHAADDGLPRLTVRVDLERRVLLHELAERHPHLLLVRLRLRLDGDGDDRLRKVHGLEDDRRVLVADRVPGRDVAQPDGRRDVAGPHFLDLLALVRVHLQEAPDPFGLLTGRVVDRRAGIEVPGVHAEEREL